MATSYCAHWMGLAPVEGVAIGVIPVGCKPKGARAAASMHDTDAPVSMRQSKATYGGIGWFAEASAEALAALIPTATFSIGPRLGLNWIVK